MIKRFCIIGLLLLVALSTRAQLYHYGVKAGLNYSTYHLSNNYVFYQSGGNNISYNAGVFFRKNIEKFYVQGDAILNIGLKGERSFKGEKVEFSKSSLSVPLVIGRSFYPGNLRLFAGLSPCIYFGEDPIFDFLQDHRLTTNGDYKNSPGLGYIVGGGYDLSRFSIDLGYSANLLGGFYTEQRSPSIRTYHRFSKSVLSFGVKIQ